MSIVALVLAIVGLAYSLTVGWCCCPPLGIVINIVGLVCALIARRKPEEDRAMATLAMFLSVAGIVVAIGRTVVMIVLGPSRYPL